MPRKTFLVSLLLLFSEFHFELRSSAQSKSELERITLAQSFKKRGFERRAVEQYESAIADIEQAGQVAPSVMNAETYQVLGECYAEVDRPAKALKAFTSAINKTVMTRSPENFWSEGKARSQLTVRYLRRAQTNCVLGRYKAALSDADAVIKWQNEKQYWRYEFRAQLEMTIGNYKDAVRDLTTAIEISPITPLYSQRAKAYEKLGEKKAAMRDRQHALESSKREF